MRLAAGITLPFLLLVTQAAAAAPCALSASVRYHAPPVCLDAYEHVETSSSSFIRGAYYAPKRAHFVIRLKDLYYEYCGVSALDWDGFKEAPERGGSYWQYYNAEIRGRFPCL